MKWLLEEQGHIRRDNDVDFGIIWPAQKSFVGQLEWPFKTPKVPDKFSCLKCIANIHPYILTMSYIIMIHVFISHFINLFVVTSTCFQMVVIMLLTCPSIFQNICIMLPLYTQHFGVHLFSFVCSILITTNRFGKLIIKIVYFIIRC